MFMKIHFSGIGGIGLSALAQMCFAKGHQIQGSDTSDTSVIWPILKQKGVTLFTRQTSENIDDSLDLLVYSEAVLATNPERVKAESLNIPQKSYFEFLGEISQTYRTIAIAGTHGKTSTTGLIARALQECKFDANIIVGTALEFLGNTNFSAGKEKVLVVEACEYRENFRFLSPEIVVLTSVEWDHVDAFPTEELYFKAFEKFVSGAQLVIAHSDDAGAKKVLQNFKGKIHWIDNTQVIDLSILGEFSKRNARQALAVGTYLGLDKNIFAKGLQKYVGASRRQEFLGFYKGIKIYDDYAHHPSEIKALLKAFKSHFSQNKVGIIFEPHQFSRTKQFFSEFLEVLSLADKSAFYPIYAARDSEQDKQFSLTEHLKNTGIELLQSEAEIQQFLAQFKTDDVVLFCGAGNISQVAHNFLQKFAKN
ncbi:hypothetical protein CSB37_01445 [bacterium DOLZORAL124_38_8]|nr:MAG: hypothetical protein CSB37_01445 [bacterium DOLZORAL124_38_8]